MLDLDELEREAGSLDGWSAGAVYDLLRHGRKHCGGWDEHDDGGIPGEGCVGLIMALPALLVRARRADELEAELARRTPAPIEPSDMVRLAQLQNED